jgi:hypothetical protein
MWNIHRAQRLLLFIRKTVTLGINSRVNETSGITAELKITSRITNLIKEILSFLANDGSSVVKTLNQTSFHMRWMVRFEVEVSAGEVGIL